MSLKYYRPISPSLRHKISILFDDLTTSKPEKTLLTRLNKTGGRVNGKVTAGRKSGGHKRHLRIIDFKREKKDIVGRVVSIEYDPNRTSNVALVFYKDGEKRYILAPIGLVVGDTVISAQKAEIKPGNALPLGSMPIGTVVHNIELMPDSGGQIVRSAGTGAIVAAREGKFVHLKLPSKEVRKVHVSCFATVGQVGNLDWKNVSFGKAGASRHRGIKPHVRGVAMDPRSHPHGGGEAKSGEGMHPKTAQGKSARGTRTRNKKKTSGKFIISRRRK